MFKHTLTLQRWLLRSGKATSIILGLLLTLGFTGMAVAESVSVAARLETAPSNLTDGQHCL